MGEKIKQKKKNLLHVLLLFSALHFFVEGICQRYIPVDSARKILLNPKNAIEKFRGLATLDRFYISTGLFDSSVVLQREMFTIANEQKNDSLMLKTYRAIGN